MNRKRLYSGDFLSIMKWWRDQFTTDFHADWRSSKATEEDFMFFITRKITIQGKKLIVTFSMTSIAVDEILA